MKIEELIQSTPPGYLSDEDVSGLLRSDFWNEDERRAALGRVVLSVHERATADAVLESARGHCRWLSERNERLVSERAGHALAALYRIGVAIGGFSLAYALGSAWPLLAAVPLLFLSPKTKN